VFIAIYRFRIQFLAECLIHRFRTFCFFLASLFFFFFSWCFFFHVYFSLCAKEVDLARKKKNCGVKKKFLFETNSSISSV
jgi:hypothetical protein